MTEGNPADPFAIPVFTAGGVVITVAQVVDAAQCRGELQPFLDEVRLLQRCSARAQEAELWSDDARLQEIADTFRYERDLITAEEAERWFAARGLTTDDFSEHVLRWYWKERLAGSLPAEDAPHSAADETRELLRVELLLGGGFETLAVASSWRLAAWCAAGRERRGDLLAQELERFLQREKIDRESLPQWLAVRAIDGRWLDLILEVEGIFRHARAALATPVEEKRALNALRMGLTQFDVETIQFDTESAAREALLCVTVDGSSMEEVAQTGGYPSQRRQLGASELPAELQARFLGVAPGGLIEPFEQGGQFHLCRVIEKKEPDLNEPRVRRAVEDHLTTTHFSDLSRLHVRWLF